MDGRGRWVEGWLDRRKQGWGGRGQRHGAGSRRTNQEVTPVQEKRDDEAWAAAREGQI